MVIVFASLAGVGLLGNLITLDLQPFGIFASLTEMPDSTCSCQGDDGSFSPANCEGFTGEYVDTNLVCTGLTPIASYGIPASDSQGCSAGFWTANADDESVWPAGYSPNFYYNSMFQTTVELSELSLTDNQEDSQVFGTNEIIADDGQPESSENVDQVVETEQVETVDESVDAEDVEIVGVQSDEVVDSDVEIVDESTESDDTEIETIEVTETEGENVESDGETVDESVETEDVEIVGAETDEIVESEDVETADNQIAEETVENETFTASEDVNGLTLAQALNQKDSSLADLLRESVAAMLNAAHPDVNYPYTVPEIMSMAQIAIASGHYDDTVNLLQKVNDKDNSPLCRASGIQASP